MASGMLVSKDVNGVFQDLKKGRKHKWITFKINDELTEIVPAVKSDPPSGDTDEEDKAGWDDLCVELKDDAPRYAVFDSRFTIEGTKKEKIIFVVWVPENATAKLKMIYASSKDYIKKALVMELELQATDVEERSYDAMLAIVKKNARI